MLSSGNALSELVTLRTTQLTQLASSQSLNRLATGTCLSSGQNDISALITGANMDAELAGLESELSVNVNTANILSTADASLSQISDVLNDIKALIADNVNISGLSDTEKKANQLRIDSGLKTINRLANNTNYGGRKLLDGSAHVSSSRSSISINSVKASDLGQTEIDGTNYDLSDLGSGQALDTTGADTTNAMTVLDAAISDVATQQGEIGAFISDTLQPSYGQILSARENLMGSLSSLGNTNDAMESARAIRAQLLEQTSTLLMSGFNKQEHVQSMVLSVLG